MIQNNANAVNAAPANAKVAVSNGIPRYRQDKDNDMKNIMENWKKFIIEGKSVDSGAIPLLLRLSFIDPDPLKGRVFKVPYYNRGKRNKELLSEKIDDYLGANKEKRVFVGPLQYKKGRIHPNTASLIIAMIEDKLGPQYLSGANLQRLILQKAPKILDKPDAKVNDYFDYVGENSGQLAADFGIIVLETMLL